MYFRSLLPCKTAHALMDTVPSRVLFLHWQCIPVGYSMDPRYIGAGWCRSGWRVPQQRASWLEGASTGLEGASTKC